MQKLTHFIHRNKILLFTLQNLHKIALYIDVDVTIAIEGTAALLVPGQLTDYVRVESFLVDVADEGAAS